MITTLAVENYRSLRRLVVPLGPLTVVTGPNGSGKSSLYRALRLLADSSRNGAVAALAREGGLQSTLWAGPEHRGKSVRDGTHPIQGTTRTGPVSLRLGFAGDEFGYAIDLGTPIPSKSVFDRDPEIKHESTWTGPVLRSATLLTDRAGTSVRIRNPAGDWQARRDVIRPYDSILSELADPQQAPELLALRDQMRSWRFYDHVRTDIDAPARTAQIGTRTPVLSHDGADLAAAIQTIAEIGNAAALHAAIDNAFPGSQVQVTTDRGRFDLTLHQHGLLRPLGAAELSDGTLRYLLWVAALLTPRPPVLLVLNEPETSLHPDLLRPLAALILGASRHTQIVVVTHSRALASALEVDGSRTGTEVGLIELVKEYGQTAIEGQRTLDEPSWHWPKR
ncbi:MAG: AAA family ATPase [Frankia sp.]